MYYLYLVLETSHLFLCYYYLFTHSFILSDAYHSRACININILIHMAYIVSCTFVSRSVKVQRWRSGSEHGETSSPHREHRAAPRLCPQPVKAEKSPRKADGQKAVIPCVIKQMQTDRAAIWYFAPRRGIFRGVAGAWGHNSTSYVRYVNNRQPKLAAVSVSAPFQPENKAKDTFSDPERENQYGFSTTNINIPSSFFFHMQKYWKAPTWSVMYRGAYMLEEVLKEERSDDRVKSSVQSSTAASHGAN